MVAYYDDAPAQESFSTLLARSQNKIHAILDNQTLPYDVLMADVRAKGWSDKLRFPVSFNYLTAMPPAVQINETAYQITDIANHQARLDLTLSVYDDEAWRCVLIISRRPLTRKRLLRLSISTIKF
nr:hypothetical protein [Pectobacterium brasiliense]